MFKLVLLSRWAAYFLQLSDTSCVLAFLITRGRLDSWEIRNPFIQLGTLPCCLAVEIHGDALVAPSRLREDLDVTFSGTRVFVCPKLDDQNQEGGPVDYNGHHGHHALGRGYQGVRAGCEVLVTQAQESTCPSSWLRLLVSIVRGGMQHLLL
jgi:hypothetical protein